MALRDEQTRHEAHELLNGGSPCGSRLDEDTMLAHTLQLINEKVMEQIALHGLFWLTIGFLGQAMFFLRFAWQWVVSEKAGRGKIPLAFWYLSLAGSLLLCMYSAFKQSGFDPVFFFAGPLQVIIYIRNLRLLHKAGQLESDAPGCKPSTSTGGPASDGPPCPVCGKPTLAGAAYCQHCGARLIPAQG